MAKVTIAKGYYLHSSQVWHIMSNTLLTVVSKLSRPTPVLALMQALH